jgi:hypothetical protein
MLGVFQDDDDMIEQLREPYIGLSYGLLDQLTGVQRSLTALRKAKLGARRGRRERYPPNGASYGPSRVCPPPDKMIGRVSRPPAHGRGARYAFKR